MSGVRFATAQALFDAFPRTTTKLNVQPTDESPRTFLEKLSSQRKFEEAVTFCAYLLPRREAVVWACKSTTTLLGPMPHRVPALAAAEAWVQDPDDQRRDVALAVGTGGDVNDPMTWLALAAGWSGGSLSLNPKAPVPAPPYLTARAVRLAILLSARMMPLPQRAQDLAGVIADGIRLAEAGL